MHNLQSIFKIPFVPHALPSFSITGIKSEVIYCLWAHPAFTALHRKPTRFGVSIKTTNHESLTTRDPPTVQRHAFSVINNNSIIKAI